MLVIVSLSRVREKNRKKKKKRELGQKSKQLIYVNQINRKFSVFSERKC